MNIGDMPEISCKIENFILTRINGECEMRERKKRHKQLQKFQYQIDMYFGA